MPKLILSRGGGFLWNRGKKNKRSEEEWLIKDCGGNLLGLASKTV